MGVTKKSKYLYLGLATTVLAGMLSACGSNNSNDSSNSASTNNAAQNNAGGKQEAVKLRMIESLTSPARTDLLKQSIKRFEDANPGITVELISPPFDQADNKIRTMLSTGENLDVLEVRDQTINEDVTNGYVENLEPYAAKWADYATVSQAAKTVASIADKPYFIANGMYERQMFYRKDWFDAAGLAAPKTWEDVYTAGKKLTDPSKNHYGFSFRGGAGGSGYIDAIAQSYNGANLDEADGRFLKDGKTTMFGSPEAKEGFELYKKIFKESAPADSINWGFAEQVQAFTSGVTAMLMQDPDVIGVLNEKMEKGTWASTFLPVGPTGKTFYGIGAAGWGMTSFSEHKEEAWKLIAFLSSPAENTAFCKAFGLLPIHSSAAEDPFFQEGPYATLLEMNTKPEDYIPLKPNYSYNSGDYGDVVMKNTQAWLLDQASTEDTLKILDKYWQDQKAKIAK
ncbi:sugar ABC transporter substrate-binding protein [Paenibacillus sp. OV219]|uniref:ABC transporter substrate-binding protein n=1 Tax=Paenibacillus sp. OV219 TaxID=1884377 RepID=UPI0008BA6111|nr:sugar ABC transporter substrate-binding protein [Paenibacillus sp. OV219]SEM56886.1 carbohydrate ABC transporter substrate-binding protein, CUT1 family [Paenibacillus sp. OV219]